MLEVSRINTMLQAELAESEAQLAALAVQQAAELSQHKDNEAARMVELWIRNKALLPGGFQPLTPETAADVMGSRGMSHDCRSQ